MSDGRRATGDGGWGNRRGFTFVELMTVIIILGLLAGISILKYIDLRNAARAAEVAGDFRTVMVAAYNYYSDHNDWPPDGSAGVVPPSLVQYLPGSFRFDKPEYTLDFDNVSMGGPNAVVGITLSTANSDLMSKLKRTLGTKQPYFQAGATLTYLISGADGEA